MANYFLPRHRFKLQTPTLHTTDPTDLMHSAVGFGIYGTKGTRIIILNLARLARLLGCQAHILGAKTIIIIVYVSMYLKAVWTVTMKELAFSVTCVCLE